jgi:hypothetical protein
MIKQVRKNKMILLLSILLCLLGASLIPALRLETKAMSRLEGQWVEVFYETEEAAAQDVFFILREKDPARLPKKLGF